MNPIVRSSFLRKVGNLFALGFWGIIGAVILLILLFQAGHWFLRESSKHKKAEIAAIFARAINDGEVSDVAGGKFVVTQRHTGDPFYTIWFTNTVGQRAGYFVSADKQGRKIWEFKELLATEMAVNRKVFFRERPQAQ